MNRRTFVRGAGAVTVLAVGGGVWRAADQGVWSVGEGPAYEPWTAWRTDRPEGALSLVRAGILASNPHNTQPWLFRVEETRIDLYADLRRHLGSFDAYRREMFLGLGCAVENMMLAGRAAGYDPSLAISAGRLDPPPAGDAPVHAARIDLGAAAVRPTDSHPLHEAIPRRHTNRGPYLPDRPLSADRLGELVAVDADEGDVRVFLLTEPAARTRFGEIVVDTTEAIIRDRKMVHDSERWYRHSRREVQQFRDGPTLDAAGLPPVRVAVAKLLPRPSAERSHDYWLANTVDIQVPTAPAFGLIAVRDLYDREQTLRAGRVWQRKQLWATTHGLAMQPLNQPVEVIDRLRSLGHDTPTARALAKLTGDAAWQPTFLFRVGYPARPAPPSPRRPLADVVVS